MNTTLQILLIFVLAGIVFVLYKILQAQSKCPYLSMIGKIGVVTDRIDPIGTIKCEGELWQAISSEVIEIGVYVIVTKVLLRGKLRVRKL